MDQQTKSDGPDRGSIIFTITHITQNTGYCLGAAILDFTMRLGQGIAPFVTLLPMPETYVREMIADMMGSSKGYTGSWDIAEWLNQNGPDMHLHDDTITFIDKVMKEIGYTLSDNCDWSWIGEFVGLHLGDPCVYCKVGHDDVEVGPCPGPRVKSYEVKNS